MSVSEAPGTVLPAKSSSFSIPHGHESDFANRKLIVSTSCVLMHAQSSKVDCVCLDVAFSVGETENWP